VTVSPIRRRKARTVEFPLGSTPAGPADGEFEATLVMTPGGEPRVRLTQLAWGAGVGWYAQQTLDLDLDEAHRIAALLARAPRSSKRRRDVERRAADDREPIDLARVRAGRPGRDRLATPGATG
jgi:hypothetical protein